MKNRLLILAIIIYIVGVTLQLDWIFFWGNNFNGDVITSQKKYFDRFPEIFQSFLKSPFSALFFAIVLSLAGYIFLIQKKIFFNIIAVTSFLCALLYFWSSL